MFAEPTPGQEALDEKLPKAWGRTGLPTSSPEPDVGYTQQMILVLIKSSPNQ